MENVTITGLTRVRNAKPNAGGSTVIAYFDCEARGLEIIGCAFVRTARKGLTVWLPKIETPQSVRRAINFTDCSLRHAMMLQARESYRALGGTDAEWVGRCIPQGPQPADDGEGLHPYRGSDEHGWPTHPLHPNYTETESEDGEDREALTTFLKGSIG